MNITKLHIVSSVCYIIFIIIITTTDTDIPITTGIVPGTLNSHNVKHR